MKKILLSCLVLLLGSSFALAQKMDRSDFYKFGNLFSTDIFAQASQSLDSVEITILYKVAFKALIFESSEQNKFRSIFQIEAAFRDESGIIRKRALKIDTARANNYEETTDEDKYVTGFFTAILPNSKYAAAVEYSDLLNKIINKGTINFSSFNDLPTKKTELTPLFTYQIDNQTVVSQLDKAARFSSDAITIFVPLSITGNDNSFSYNIRKKSEKAELNWGSFGEITGSAELLKDAKMKFSKDADRITARAGISTTSLISSTNTSLNNLNFSILKIELLGNRFLPGSYYLELVNDRTQDSLRCDFKIIWENMPLALRNPEYAAETMKYILTYEELDKMESGSVNEIFAKIRDYWRNQDPSPETPYNEAMAAYFERVDYAFFNFQTIAVKDGAMTDKGMIHILFGSPSNIETSLNNGKSKEIWTYSKLNKEFTFELVAAGEYKLAQIKE